MPRRIRFGRLVNRLTLLLNCGAAVLTLSAGYLELRRELRILPFVETTWRGDPFTLSVPPPQIPEVRLVSHEQPPPPPPPSDPGVLVDKLIEPDGAATFRVVVLSDQYSWRYADSEVTELGGMADAVRTYLAGPFMQERLRHPEIVAVGAASCEGGKAEEEARAIERACRLGGWIKDALPPPETQRVHRVSLGKRRVDHASECVSGATAHQRRVVIVGVVEKAPDVDLFDALERAFTSGEVPDLHPGLYTRFDLVGACPEPTL